MKVAAEWFRSRAVRPGLTRVDEQHADVLVMSNIWHVRGSERDLIVDTGLGVASLRHHLPQLFERDPVAVLTHAHFDHIGGANEFDTCWAHPGESFERPEPASLNGAAALASIGLSAGDLEFPVADWLVDALPHEVYELEEYKVSPPRIARWLGEGDIIDLGNRSFRVLHLPGHSPASIALFDDHDGTLFSGDVLYDGELLDTCTGADIDQYVDSLVRLRDLRVSQVHAGHGDSFDDDRKRRLIDDYIGSIMSAGRAS